MSLLKAWRGVVLESGEIVAWPSLLLTHEDAFAAIPLLSRYRARWRQWSTDEPVDFDPDTSPEDRAAVKAWIERANS